VGLRRDGERLSGRLGDIALRAGDSLMLAVGRDFLKRGNLSRNFLIIDNDVVSHRLPLKKSLPISLGLVAAITGSVLGWFPLVNGLMFLLLFMLALDLFSVAELRRRFPFEIWVIVASALAVAQAVIDSGLMALMMDQLSPAIASVSPFMMLLCIYVLTLVLTELMTNNAAAALMFPLSYALATSAGLAPMAFVMAVALGGSASFLTPFGYTTNLMVQNLGGYTRSDYLRFGWLVSLAFSSVVMFLLPRVFPLQ
jgi:di/tricarboxylate transporter